MDALKRNADFIAAAVVFLIAGYLNHWGNWLGTGFLTLAAFVLVDHYYPPAQQGWPG